MTLHANDPSPSTSVSANKSAKAMSLPLGIPLVIINFLVPIIFLYGLFFLVDLFEVGFFAFIYSTVLFVSGSIILSLRFPESKKSPLVNIQTLSYVISIVFISYIISILFLVTKFFSI